uniref:Uncharacterized protein n=1 Tax=Populus trichocarpa TaxID=3694 RepID=A0A2K1Z288_POPTR
MIANHIPSATPHSMEKSRQALPSLAKILHNARCASKRTWKRINGSNSRALSFSRGIKISSSFLKHIRRI